MNLFDETKPLPITKEQVWAAWKAVKSNDGSYGVDKVSIAEIESNPHKYLYKVWNRRRATGSQVEAITHRQ